MPTIRRSYLLIGLAALACAVGLFFAVRAMSTSRGDIAAPNPSEASSSPRPDPSPQPKPFEVEVVKARSESIQSSTLFGRKASDNPATVKDAADAAAGVLQRYLTAQFVDAESRFTAAPVRALLTQEAFKSLRKPDLSALGVSSLKVAGGSRGHARTKALVLHDGDAAHAVTLQYRASIKLIVGDKPKPLVQEGTLVFTRGPDGWRADLADVRLSLPPPPKPEDKPRPPKRNAPAEEATP